MTLPLNHRVGRLFFAILLLCSDFVKGGPARLTESANVLCRYSRKDIAIALARQFAFRGSVRSVQRSSSGRELYCVGTEKTGKKSLFVISDSTSRILECPASIAFMNDQHQIVAWTEDYKQGIQFVGGEVLALPAHALFDVDPSGEYFLIGEKPSLTWLGRINSPTQRVCVSSNLLGQNVFKRGKDILITGQQFQTNSNGIEGFPICVVLSADANHRIKQTHSFSSAGAVLDVDQRSKCYALSTRSDLFPSLGIFNEDSGKTTKVGNLADWVFFLERDLLRKVRK